MPQVRKIQSLDSLIAAPFITCEFGGVQFGLRNKYNSQTQTRDIQYVTSLSIDKRASGSVNMYTMNFVYVVTPGADPNYIDLLISTAQDRKIIFSYGDSSQPEYSYNKEQAIITKITPNINISSASIAYTFTATSSIALSYSVARNYPKRGVMKPSDAIFQLLYGEDNGLLDLFQGMRSREKVQSRGWICTNDIAVDIDAKQDISPLNYLRYLLSLMRSVDDSFYAMLIHDEPETEDGPYFEIVNSLLHQGAGTTYSVDIDVGYPSDTPVYQFTPSQDTSLALITAYQGKFDKPRVININDMGQPEVTETPSLAIKNGHASPELVQWWKSMTTYPVKATLKVRGLIKPSILCDYLKINIYFFGQKYNYSGYYMVVAQKDTIDLSGYSTELSLIRVEGEQDV